MALRTIDSASSRRVIITGGGLRPMRCMAASSAAIVPWRCSSEPRRCFSCASSSPSRDFDQRQLGFAQVDELAGLEQPGVDALALGGDLVEIRLQLLGAASAWPPAGRCRSPGACAPPRARACPAPRPAPAAPRLPAATTQAPSCSSRARHVLAQSLPSSSLEADRAAFSRIARLRSHIRRIPYQRITPIVAWVSCAATAGACCAGCCRRTQPCAAGHPIAAILRITRACAMQDDRFAYLTMPPCSPCWSCCWPGLWNMMRGTSPNLSQTLMRWRVGLQFLAIVIAHAAGVFLAPMSADRGWTGTAALDSALLHARSGQEYRNDGRPQQDLHANRRCRHDRPRHGQARAQARAAHRRLRHGRRDQRRHRHGPHASGRPPRPRCQAGAHPERSVRSRRRSRVPDTRRTAGARAVARDRRPGQAARGRDRRA